MEKLIKLLNERMKEEEKIGPKHSRFLNYDGINHVFRLNNGCSFCMEFVLSKRYGFIKRLVENDKIDPEGILAENLTYTHFQIPPQYFRGGKYKNITEQMLDTFYLRILACLSIQDNPIKFLISILK